MKGQQTQDTSTVPEGYRIESYDGRWYAEYLDIWENWQPFRVIFDDSLFDFSSWDKALKFIQRHISNGAEAKRKAREEYYRSEGTLPKLPYHELSQWLGKLRLHERYTSASDIGLQDMAIAVEFRYGAYYLRILEPRAQHETPGLPLPLEIIQRELELAVVHLGAKRVLNATLTEIKRQRHAYYVELMRPLPCTCAVCGAQNLKSYIQVGGKLFCTQHDPTLTVAESNEIVGGG